MSRLKIAVPKGALLEPVVSRLGAAGLDISVLEKAGRRLCLRTDGVEYIIARAADVPTFVEWGAVDLGFVGSDILLEGDYDVFELLDLAIGKCRLVRAAPADRRERPGGAGGRMTIATKYPNLAAEYVAKNGLQAEMVKLYGSMELAPMVGLADQIIDLTATGRTLSDNGLEIVDEIMEVSCRLIANYVSYKLKSERINDLVDKVNVKN